MEDVMILESRISSGGTVASGVDDLLLFFDFVRGEAVPDQSDWTSAGERRERVGSGWNMWTSESWVEYVSGRLLLTSMGKEGRHGRVRPLGMSTPSHIGHPNHHENNWWPDSGTVPWPPLAHSFLERM